MTGPNDFLGLTRARIGELCAERGLPPYTGTQLTEWVYGRGIVDPDAMTNISKAHRAELPALFRFRSASVLAHQHATDGTQKLLLGWTDEAASPSAGAGDGTGLPVLGQRTGRETETVMIPTPDRRTACVSSQVGCPVGCAFCASGLGGLEGNLTTARIVEQVHRLTALPDVGRITNVVFMGMGEPLANYRAVTDAIRILNAPWAFGISARRITVSTVGLPAAIRRLVGFDVPVTLALSLHAPNDALRRRLIPWAEYSTIAELLDACDEYFRKTGREITLEYILLGNVNDRPEHARELAALAGRLRANINLIRYNEVASLPFARPETEDVLRFQGILRKHRVNAHIRASRGRDIAAACGQLRHERRQDAQPSSSTAAD